MKIKTKLALSYTSIILSILLVVLVFVFLITIKTIDENYYTLLLEKALITAQKNFEKDELNQLAYQKILDTYQDLMPETKEKVIVANNKREAVAELKPYLSEDQIDNLFNKKQIKLKINQLDGAAIYYPDNEGDFIVIVTSKNVQGEYIKHILKKILLITLLISSILTFGLLWWNASLIIRPLQQIVSHIQIITAKDLHIRLPERKGDDELAHMVRFFNKMIERLEISFNSQRVFIANASHELKNPLTAIMGECEVMQLKEFTQEEYKESIKRIAFETERLGSVVNNLFLLTQVDLDLSESNLEDLLIQEELNSIISYFELTKYKGRIQFEHDHSKFYIKANKYLLSVALQNIIDNACKYSKQEVIVKAFQTKSGFKINVIDRGIGIPLSEIHNVFDVFHRATNTYDYEGSGIGLSLARNILILFNADIQIESIENSGTNVSITWKNTF